MQRHWLTFQQFNGFTYQNKYSVSRPPPTPNVLTQTWMNSCNDTRRTGLVDLVDDEKTSMDGSENNSNVIDENADNYEIYLHFVF